MSCVPFGALNMGSATRGKAIAAREA